MKRQREESLRLETVMRRVAALVSFVAVGLMAVGFVDTVIFTPVHQFPGPVALPVDRLLHVAGVPWGLWAMSAGIVLLALLPFLRVLLALVLFLRQKAWGDVLASFIVLIELLMSMHVEG